MEPVKNVDHAKKSCNKTRFQTVPSLWGALVGLSPKNKTPRPPALKHQTL